MSSIMIVEDNPNNMRLFRQILAEIDQNLKITEATTGKEAIEQGKDPSHDIVIMDISLPDIDGIEAHRVLKTYPTSNQTVFIAVTAHTSNTDQKKLLEVFDYFLPKPVDEDEMIDLIETVLQKQNEH